ncbi:MAG: hypothetical protein WAO71_08390 [Gallionella sp.]
MRIKYRDFLLTTDNNIATAIVVSEIALVALVIAGLLLHRI